MVQDADDEDPPTLRMEVLEEHLRTGVGPGRIMGAVDDDEREVVEHLEPTRHHYLGEALLYEFFRYRRGEERFDSGQRNRRVVALMTTVQRHEDIGVDSGRSADVEHPAADRKVVLEAVEVLAPLEDDSTPLVAEDLGQFGVGLTEHHRARRLDDAGLLTGDVDLGRPRELGVVERDVGDHGHLRVDHVGGIPAAEQTDLDHGDVDREIGEPAQRCRRDRFKMRRQDACEDFQVCDGTDLLGEIVVADRFTVVGHPLVDPFEVRTRIRADGQPVGHQQPGDHLRRGALAVGAGDVDHRVCALRIAHH